MSAGAGEEPIRLTEEEWKNRSYWDTTSDEYQEMHGPQLNTRPCAWGIWCLPEDELQVLGDVRGKDVLELACGAAQWSIGLAQRGARPVGLDTSERQLEHARRLMGEAGVTFPLIHGSAEAVPLPAASFDVVFSDFGAMMFSDPVRTVPEAARLLRPGGLLAFNMESPLMSLAWSGHARRVERYFQFPYFGMYRFGDATRASYQLPYGEWIRLFRRHGLRVEDLIELQPPANATTTHNDWPLEWVRDWPGENIWKVRKPA